MNAALDIAGLNERHAGLTPALAQSYAEAAFVCFSRHHLPPVTLSLRYAGDHYTRVADFEVPGARVCNAYANRDDATRDGAYGISLAAVEAVAGLVAVSRAETLTGADWYLAPIGADVEDLESRIRLEVSGINIGAKPDIERRLREKIAQTIRGQSNLPAMAAVVGFKALEVAISSVGDEHGLVEPS